jgi:hypothetical protein
MVVSSTGRWCQVTVSAGTKTECANLGSAERSVHYLGSEKKNTHYQIIPLGVDRSLFCHLISMSTLIMLRGLQTNLVIGDGFPYAFEEPSNLPAVLNGVGKSLWFRFFSPGPQLPFDVLELAGRNSTPRTVREIDSLQYHFATAVLLFPAAWRRTIEPFFQRNYT